MEVPWLASCYFSQRVLVQSGRKLSILLKDDYDRLSAILGQVHP